MVALHGGAPLWWPQWRISNWRPWSHHMSTSHQNLSMRPNITTVDWGQLLRLMKSLKVGWMIWSTHANGIGQESKVVTNWRAGRQLRFIQISTSDPHTSWGLHGLFASTFWQLPWCCIRPPRSTSLGTFPPHRPFPPHIHALRICTKTCGILMSRWHKPGNVIQIFNIVYLNCVHLNDQFLQNSLTWSSRRACHECSDSVWRRLLKTIISVCAPGLASLSRFVRFWTIRATPFEHAYFWIDE